ncbi:MAG: hypothetical protein V4547_17880 [Bacteroidota bacterium]
MQIKLNDNTNTQKKKLPKPPRITIMELLAVNCTAQSRALLDKYNAPQPKNYEDLKDKLAELYTNCPDKKQLEKEFAEMHPHKEWIIDYVAPAPVKADIKVEPVKTEQVTKVLDDGYYNMHGPSNQRHSCSCGCGGHSNFLGANTGTQSNKVDPNMIIGILAIVTFAGLVLYTHKR